MRKTTIHSYKYPNLGCNARFVANINKLQAMLRRQHTLTILTLLFILLGTFGLTAKPLRLVVEDIIDLSKFDGKVVIMEYDGKGQFSFKSSNYKETVKYEKQVPIKISDTISNYEQLLHISEVSFNPVFSLHQKK